MKKNVGWKAIDNIATAIVMAIAGWSAVYGQWDKGSFFVLCAILFQLPPRSMWEE